MTEENQNGDVVVSAISFIKSFSLVVSFPVKKNDVKILANSQLSVNPIQTLTRVICGYVVC